MRKLGIKATARAAGLLAIGAAIVATDVHIRQHSVSPADRAAAGAAAPRDPLARELRRCQAIGMAAKDDAACEAAWAENRRRFFAPLSERTPAGAASESTAGPPK
jgi:conjugative transfer region protein TrbK